MNKKIDELERLISKLEKENRDLVERNIDLKGKLDTINNSRGMRILKKYYKVRDKILPFGSRRRTIVKRIYNKVLSVVGVDKNKSRIINSQEETKYFLWDYKINKKLVVLTTKHCMFIAKLIEASAGKAGIGVEIIIDKPENGFKKLPHIVITPQMFEELPEMYVAFQMEQSVSSRWFTDRYYSKLKNAVAVFDYSLKNIEFLSREIELSKVFYLPISKFNNFMKEEFYTEKEYDVVFYGDDNCERRKNIIRELSKQFRVKVINNLFGEELYKELRKARIVVNIHYYEGALLETTRLYEVLSLNTSVVISEKSIDMDEHKNIEAVVDFVEIGNIDGFVEKISYYLDDETRIKEKIKENCNIFLLEKVTAFDYYFQRFLLATDNIEFDDFYNNVSSFIKFRSDFWCLGLPEYIRRKRAFDEINNYGIEYFPGIRHYFGWIGCGMSYKFMLRKAREKNMETVSICEDDVLFKNDFYENYLSIKRYLKNNDVDWDIFNGLIADVHKDTKIESIDSYNGIDFIKLDKMTSTVCNIYNNRYLDKLELWDSNDRNVETNTIDRYIERACNRKIITTLPFLVSCQDELQSTLWGFNNTQYNAMIEASISRLKGKVKEFKKRNEGLQ